jgi:hypothetical protein
VTKKINATIGTESKNLFRRHRQNILLSHEIIFKQCRIQKGSITSDLKSKADFSKTKLNTCVIKNFGVFMFYFLFHSANNRMTTTKKIQLFYFSKGNKSSVKEASTNFTQKTCTYLKPQIHSQLQSYLCILNQ